MSTRKKVTSAPGSPRPTENRADEGVCERQGDKRGGDSLIARYIEPGPLGLGPAEAQVIGHGVSVWALMAHLQAVDNDSARAATDYGLDQEAVEAAIRYYCRHRELIDARIALNRSYFVS